MSYTFQLGVALDQHTLDAEHRQRCFLVEIEGIGQRNGIAGTGKGNRRRHEGLVTPRRDVNISRRHRRAINRRHVLGIGLAQHALPLDRSVTGRRRRRRRGSEQSQHLGMRGIPGHGLRKVDQWPPASPVFAGPGENGRNRRGRQSGNELVGLRGGHERSLLE